jgi:hypothetical protein
VRPELSTKQQDVILDGVSVSLQTDNLRIDPVPEPSSFAVLAGLFACVGVALRRKQQDAEKFACKAVNIGDQTILNCASETLVEALSRAGSRRSSLRSRNSSGQAAPRSV